MKFTPIEPPREFQVGDGGEITIRDCARLTLEADEQISLVTAAGGEWDITRKDWGYYASPSLGRRLKRFGLRACLVGSARGDKFIWMVEIGKEPLMEQYMREQEIEVILWLDEVPGD